MFGFSIGEILFLGALGLIVIGPKQLPELARNLGRLLNELRRATEGFTTDLKNQARVDFDMKPRPPTPPVPPEATGAAAPVENPAEYYAPIQTHPAANHPAGLNPHSHPAPTTADDLGAAMPTKKDDGNFS